MNAQDAIKILRNLQKRSRKKIVNFLGIPNGEYDDIVAECNAIEVAIKALEKQKPKRPIIKEWDTARCPSCGAALSEHLGDGYYKHPTWMKRCPNEECSQRLDWGEE